jgi:septum formation protein
VYPIVAAPGYDIKYVYRVMFWLCEVSSTNFRSIDERTLVRFADSPVRLLEAYVDSGEGVDRAGGFAIQVQRILYRPFTK